MAKAQLLAGSTSIIREILILSSASTSGGGLTGVSSASGGITIAYKRDTASASVVSGVGLTIDASSGVTLGTYEPSDNAHCAIKEVDSTNMPGIYEFHLPNNALASGAKSVVFYIQGVANMVPCRLEIELTAINNQDSQRAGLAVLPSSGSIFATTGDPCALIEGVTTPALTMSGSSIGAANGTYQVYSYSTTILYNSRQVWNNGSYYLWTNNTNWYISAVIGTPGATYWSGVYVNPIPYGLALASNGSNGTISIAYASADMAAVSPNLQIVNPMVQNNGGTIFFKMSADPATPTVTQSNTNGATFNSTNSQTITTIIAASAVNGVYSLPLTATETNTIGLLMVKIINAGVTYYLETTVLAGNIGQIAYGTVNAVTSNSDFTLTSTALSSNNNDYNNMWLIFTTGNNTYIPRVIGNYIGSGKEVQFTGTGMRGAFPETVQPGDNFQILAGSP